MNIEFLKQILQENLFYIDVLLNNKAASKKEYEDNLLIINNCALLFEDIKPILKQKYEPTSTENGIIILIDEVLPLTLLLCNKYNDLDACDKKEIYETYTHIKKLYTDLYGESRLLC